MKPPTRLSLAWLALRELGPRPVFLVLLYRLGLHTGYYRRQLAQASWSLALPTPELSIQTVLPHPDFQPLSKTLDSSMIERCLAEAAEILDGRVRLFGREPVELRLTPPAPLADWTEFELGRAAYPDPLDPIDPEPGSTDVKFIWEPARFDWAYTLARAYILSGDERFAAGFWRLAETFLAANPPYQGPNWVSAQEAALRILAFTFCSHQFASSVHTTPPRRILLAQAVAAHALRIPSTLVYSRAQNNNHLLSEAAGLFTAGVGLPAHPQASRWRQLGWRWFNHAVQTQIDPSGAYCQHSANYQRLILQLALWMNALGQSCSQPLPQQTLDLLARATHWMLALTDPTTGQLPNLGPNDGALIQPLSSCPFADYRPVLQAAGRAFLEGPPFSPGAWDETSYWFDLVKPDEKALPPLQSAAAPHILHSPDGHSWAYLRIARFHSRPGHADQLHLDLWWRGLNIAQDPGTYRYSAPPPWDNSLTHSAVHNTITVNNTEQMLRAGRFLYLRWAQAYPAAELSGESTPVPNFIPAASLSAWHTGYQRLGVRHHRAVTVSPHNDWSVEDSLLPLPKNPVPPHSDYQVRLAWLLPDWPWELNDAALHLQTPLGILTLTIAPGITVSPASFQVFLDRAGQRLAGAGNPDPTCGWYSPTYAEKQPALSFSIIARASLGLVFTSQWSFPVE